MDRGSTGGVILATGLSPAWQQILTFDSVQLGAVNRARETHACASGKVLNVGLALHHLQARARTLCLIGGVTGERIESEFAATGVDCGWIRSQSPTRVCTTLIEQGTQTVTELVENALPISADELEQFTAAYREEAAEASVVVLTGSLPAGAPVAYYRTLLSYTASRVILDAQGATLLEALPGSPFLIKPNRIELAQTLGRDLSNDASLFSAMREMRSRGAQWVVVTDGKQAVWAAGPDGVSRLQPPKMTDVINPIGSGDCLTAGLAWRLSLGDTVPEALRFGIAAAADNARQLLPARICLERVTELADDVRAERVE